MRSRRHKERETMREGMDKPSRQCVQRKFTEHFKSLGAGLIIDEMKETVMTLIEHPDEWMNDSIHPKAFIGFIFSQ